jgi:hypothetical protein
MNPILSSTIEFDSYITSKLVNKRNKIVSNSGKDLLSNQSINGDKIIFQKQERVEIQGVNRSFTTKKEEENQFVPQVHSWRQYVSKIDPPTVPTRNKELRLKSLKRWFDDWQVESRISSGLLRARLEVFQRHSKQFSLRYSLSQWAAAGKAASFQRGRLALTARIALRQALRRISSRRTSVRRGEAQFAQSGGKRALSLLAARATARAAQRGQTLRARRHLHRGLARRAFSGWVVFSRRAKDERLLESEQSSRRAKIQSFVTSLSLNHGHNNNLSNHNNNNLTQINKTSGILTPNTYRPQRVDIKRGSTKPISDNKVSGSNSNIGGVNAQTRSASAGSMRISQNRKKETSNNDMLSTNRLTNYQKNNSEALNKLSTNFDSNIEDDLPPPPAYNLVAGK